MDTVEVCDIFVSFPIKVNIYPILLWNTLEELIMGAVPLDLLEIYLPSFFFYNGV